MSSLAIRYASTAVCVSLLSVVTAASAQERQPIRFSHPSSSVAQAAAPQGLLYVAYSQNDPVVSVYPIMASGRAKPLYEIQGPHTGVRSPSAIAVAANGIVYIPNLGGYGAAASIAVIPTGNGDVPAKAILSCSLTQSYGAALDAQSNIHVGDTGPSADSAAILTFGNNANGCMAPINKISGPRTKLVTPLGLALDPQGRALEADATGSVNGYGPGAVGNVAPSLRITGPQTGLTGPRALGLDYRTNIYVTNIPNYPPGQPSILEFAHNANGNVSPMRWISGSKTLLNNPRGIAISKRTGEIYVADDLGVLVFAATARGNVAPIRIMQSNEGAVGGVALRE